MRCVARLRANGPPGAGVTRPVHEPWTTIGVMRPEWFPRDPAVGIPRAGGGWDVTMLQGDELLFSRRCVDDRGRPLRGGVVPDGHAQGGLRGRGRMAA